MTVQNFNILDTTLGDRVLDGPTIAALLAQGGESAVAVGASAGFTKASAGTTTLIAATAVDRIVTISVQVTTVYATGDGAQPTIAIGQTSATTKFAATSAFTSAAAGTTFSFGGVLSANTALLVTAVAGTGTTETGAMTVTAQVTAKA